MNCNLNSTLKESETAFLSCEDQKYANCCPIKERLPKDEEGVLVPALLLDKFVEQGK